MSDTPGFNRRRFCAAVAATAAAGPLGLLGFSRRLEAMTALTPTHKAIPGATETVEFTVPAPKTETRD